MSLLIYLWWVDEKIYEKDCRGFYMSKEITEGDFKLKIWVIKYVMERKRENSKRERTTREERAKQWTWNEPKGSGLSSRWTHKLKIVYQRNESDKGCGNKLKPKNGKGRILVPEWPQSYVDPAEQSAENKQACPWHGIKAIAESYNDKEWKKPQYSLWKEGAMNMKTPMIKKKGKWMPANFR